MKRNDWPNVLLASSTAMSAAVVLALFAFPMLTGAPLFERNSVPAIACVVLYFLSWGLLASGLVSTVLWRDKYPATSKAGPLWFVLSLVLLLAGPLIAILSHPHSIA